VSGLLFMGVAQLRLLRRCSMASASGSVMYLLAIL
jgi:hypothetical protein